MNKKRFIIKFILMILLPVIYMIFRHILNLYQYTFTNLSFYIVLAAWLYCSFSTVMESYRYTKDDNQKVSIRFLSGWGVYLGVISIVIAIFMFFGDALIGDHDEEFLTINNEKVVSYRIKANFTDYYPRKTIFIRSIVPSYGRHDGHDIAKY